MSEIRAYTTLAIHKRLFLVSLMYAIYDHADAITGRDSSVAVRSEGRAWDMLPRGVP